MRRTRRRAAGWTPHMTGSDKHSHKHHLSGKTVASQSTHSLTTFCAFYAAAAPAAMISLLGPLSAMYSTSHRGNRHCSIRQQWVATMLSPWRPICPTMGSRSATIERPHAHALTADRRESNNYECNNVLPRGTLEVNSKFQTEQIPWIYFNFCNYFCLTTGCAGAVVRGD